MRACSGWWMALPEADRTAWLIYADSVVDELYWEGEFGWELAWVEYAWDAATELSLAHIPVIEVRP